MRIVVLATEEQKQEIITCKNADNKTDLIFTENISEIKVYKDFDAFFLLISTPSILNWDFFGKPVVINSVIDTLESKKLASNFSRINAWPGFLGRPVWEIASNNKAATAEIFRSLGWEIVFVKDEPGLVAARILSMIINEAYFALGENVSTKQEIDLAMKSGTNYPWGPFEWHNKIGVENIYLLLKKLSETSKRYLIAPQLEEKFKNLAFPQSL